MRFWQCLSLGLLLIITAMACQEKRTGKLADFPSIEVSGANLQYVSDPRTGLCFATMASSDLTTKEFIVTGLTLVPCDKIPR